MEDEIYNLNFNGNSIFSEPKHRERTETIDPTLSSINYEKKYGVSSSSSE